ncbi:gamma-bungarotoxin-like [Megalobrama amblycephala]|uniref:gamma-bungarotoxin-like n=1 Tax=Megalobrama amblycephala TaxID=75352 RepID=UPI0020145B5D|nr:gamma-bungarotoxin-like [Megalobrama amblycephala]XP_048036357.1 gamma-bungarotoxin-like [Megalobrama amblycephala]
MDLRVSVVLLFFFFTGGYSLKCYSCSSDSMGSCDTTETCKDGSSKCESRIFEQTDGSSKVSVTTKGCVEKCDARTRNLPTGGTVSVHCCDTDLCNAADGVFKGSFLLLFSPLLFYFLFQ